MNPPANKNIFHFLSEPVRAGARVFISPHASVNGDVVLDDDASIWPMAVVRGDVNHIRIGARTNIQDGAVLHVSHDSKFMPGGSALLIGEEVTIGHGAILHGCTIGPRCLVGMGAIVLDGAVLEEESMIAAGALVTPGTVVKSRTLWKGNPARLARDLSPEQIEFLSYSAAHYVRLKDLYLSNPTPSREP